MTYRVKKNKKDNNLKILGDIFVKNNKNKGKLIYKNKRYPLKNFISIEKIKVTELKIKMLLEKDCSNKSSMFSFCDLLLNLKIDVDKPKEETDGIINKNLIPKAPIVQTFNDVTETISDELSEMSRLYTSEIIAVEQTSFEDFLINMKNDFEFAENKMKKINNITIMNKMFYCCSLLKSITVLSNLNSYNVYDITKIFYKCKSLISLPEIISYWNTENEYDMSYLFYYCSQLKILPDISKWNTDNVIFMNNMFYECSSLVSLPDISKWNTENVIYMNGLFYKCSKLFDLNCITNWDVTNVIDINSMFCGCQSLQILPNLSKWNIKKIIDMKKLFRQCSSLTSIPDISNWKTENVTNMSELFANCSSLKEIPNISIWCTKNNLVCFVNVH